MYTVSVIMPVFNNEKTLRKSIESILNQTIYDFELILINDGSTDTSAQICDEYEKLEPLFVEVVHQKRNGFSAARNKGLSIAKGKYVYFASAHDIFDHRMLQDNVDIAEEKNADLTVFGFTVHNENSGLEFEQHQPNLPYLPNQEEFRNHYRNFHHFYPYVLFNKLYRRSYLVKHRLKFFNVSHDEGAFFNLSAYERMESVVFNRNTYFIRSIEELTKENTFDINIEIAKHLEALLIYWNMEDEFEDLILSSYFHAIYEELENISTEHSPLSLEEQEEYIENILKDRRLSPYLKDFKNIKEKNPYRLALISALQNGNGKAAIQIVTRTKETKAKTSKVTGFFRNIFKKNS